MKKILLVLLLLTTSAIAHEWYPKSCCSGNDCYSIPASDVEALPNGCWKVKATGEIFSGPNGGKCSMKSVKFSPDGGFHRCSLNGDREATTICLFIPLPAGS